MITPESPIYRKAFENYLRKGVPIDVYIKAFGETAGHHTTPAYLWRTQEDEKVRSSHAANNLRVFSWDNPPPTGHPGVAPHCRCRAEPFYFNDAGAADALALLIPSTGMLQRIARQIFGRRKPTEETVIEILKPNGEPIGKQGMRPKVRIAKGGKEAAEKLFEKLSRGGTPESRTGYPGKGVKLPNGGWVGYREISKSGSPTIDIDIKGIGFEKIHFDL